MSNVKVQYGQTLLDIAMQTLGDIERVFEIADLNNLLLTDDLTAGGLLRIPEPDGSKKQIVNFFKQPSHCPASADNSAGELGVLEGIGYWAISDDFVVQ